MTYVMWKAPLNSNQPTNRNNVMADKAFSVSAPRIWNDLPLNCRVATYVNSFKCNLKHKLFYADYYR